MIKTYANCEMCLGGKKDDVKPDVDRRKCGKMTWMVRRKRYVNGVDSWRQTLKSVERGRKSKRQDEADGERVKVNQGQSSTAAVSS